MRQFFKRLIKKVLYKTIKFFKHKMTNGNPVFEDNEKICAAVCRKLITHPNSKFLIAPLSMKRYIKNSELDLFIVLQDKRVSITNHVYHYDVSMTDRNWDRITNMYDNKTERIRQEFETEMKSQIKHSLSTILTKVI